MKGGAQKEGDRRRAGIGGVMQRRGTQEKGTSKELGERQGHRNGNK